MAGGLAARNDTLHPTGPPLRRLLKALQLVIAPGGLPSGAGAAHPPSFGEGSAREVARLSLPTHGDIIEKRLSAARLHLAEASGDALRSEEESDSGSDSGEDDGEGEPGLEGMAESSAPGDADHSGIRISYSEGPTGKHGPSSPIPRFCVPPSSAPVTAPAASKPLLEAISRPALWAVASIDLCNYDLDRLETDASRSNMYTDIVRQSGGSDPRGHGRIVQTTDKRGTVRRYPLRQGEWGGMADRQQVMMGVAAVRVMQSMQGWLALEAGPMEGREGLSVPDYTLGSWDIKLIRHSLAIVMYLLNSLCLSHLRRVAEYHSSSASPPGYGSSGSGAGPTGPFYTRSQGALEHAEKDGPPEAPPAIQTLVSPLLALLQPASASGLTPATAQAGTGPSIEATTSSQMPTTLALLIAPHICPILTVALLIFYDPVRLPAVHQADRAALMRTLNGLAPRVVLSALNGVLAFCRPDRGAQVGDIGPGAMCMAGEDGSDSGAASGSIPAPSSRGDAEWYHPYPPYLPTQTSRLLTSHLLRPGGIRALLENTLPIDAEGPIAGAGQSDVMAKARNVARMISRGPDMKGQEGGTGRYVRHCIREAQIVFTPPSEGQAGQVQEEGQGQSKRAPRAWRVAMAEAILQLEEGKEGDIVRYGLAGPLVLSSSTSHGGTRSPDGNESEASHGHAHPLAQIRALALLQGILQHASPSAAFYRRVVDPILDSLMLLVSPSASFSGGAAKSTVSATGKGQQADQISKLARNVILLYTDLVDPLAGADALYAACLINVQSAKWKVEPQPDLLLSGETDMEVEAGSETKHSKATAWLEDVDRKQLLVHLQEKLSGVLDRPGAASGNGAILEVHLKSLEELRRVVQDRVRGLRENSTAENQV